MAPPVFPTLPPSESRPTARVVFQYMVTTAFAKDPFCEFLQRHIQPPPACPLEMLTVPGPAAPHVVHVVCARSSKRPPGSELTIATWAAQTLVDMDWYSKQRKETK
jgi:hypothetical protein